ncbi:peptidyl-prolyl cis-trans isomerase [Priestia megaterium]|nr:peptidyl-prolyl cis-trans isomerase [Priestia megaterium]
MNSFIRLQGNVRYKLTLDPGVWIFDDRKVDLTTYFDEEEKKEDANVAYTKAVSKHWDREIQEGAVFPPTLKTEKKFEKQKLLTGTFGIPFEPFLGNAEPNEQAQTVTFITDTGSISFPLEEAKTLIFGFSKEGKPLREDGPIHVYKKDGSNRKEPIKNVKEIIIT